MLAQSSFGSIDLSLILDTQRFSLRGAEQSPQWLQTARLNEHTPETLEYGISSFTFRSLRPFHPARLGEGGGESRFVG